MKKRVLGKSGLEVSALGSWRNLLRVVQPETQRTPVPAERPPEGNIVARPVLGGLHHDYRRVA
jgi:hypothetical protein